MASENGQERRETLADIVAMLRANARGERFDEFSFSSLADRIEAAWKREREPVGNPDRSEIAVELREKADQYHNNNGHPTWEDMEGVSKYLLNLADRIDVFILKKAWERAFRMAPGNAAAMREALVKLRAEIKRFYNNEWIPYDAWQGCDDMISHAFSAPARQCDVGTAEEQGMRFSDYCRKHYDLTFDLDSDPCKACPFSAMPSECRFAWGQTPYAAEEGGAE